MVTRGYRRLWVTGGYKRLQGVTKDYRGMQAVTRVTISNMGLQGVTGGYKRLQGDTRGYMGTRGYRGLQGVTEGYKRLQRVTRGYRGLKEVTGR